MEDNKVIHSSFWGNLFKSPAEKADLEEILKSVPLFQHFNKRDLILLADIVHSRVYLPGEYIFYQGDPGIGLYMIRSGDVEIVRSFENGNLLSLAHFTKGDFFGELALIDGEKRSASAIARTETKLAVIFKPDLDEIIEKFPKKGIKIHQGISQIIVTRLRTLNEEYFILLNKTNIKEESNYGAEY